MKTVTSMGGLTTRTATPRASGGGPRWVALALLFGGACGRIDYTPLPRSDEVKVGSDAGADLPRREDGGSALRIDGPRDTEELSRIDGARDAGPDRPPPLDSPLPPDGPPLALDGAVDKGVPDAPAPPDVAPADVRTAPDVPPDLPPDLAPPKPLDLCSTIPLLAADPVIDGKLDGNLYLQPLEPTIWVGPLSPAGHRADFAIAWRPNGLYFFVQVVDPAVICNQSTLLECVDSAELFVDDDGRFTSPPNYDSPGTRQFMVGAPNGTTSQSLFSAHSFPQGLLTRGTFARALSVPVPGGYALEAFFIADDLGLPRWTLQAGNRVGIDLGINVFDGPGTTNDCATGQNQFQLRRSAQGAYPAQDVRAFCTPRLLP